MTCLISVYIVFASCAHASEPDLMQRWVERSERLDSLYVEGRIEQFRVPMEQDPAVQENWVKRPGRCPTANFTAWLRRPDFRINMRAVGGAITENQDFAWLDGKLWSLGGIGGPKDRMGATVTGDTRLGHLSIEPFLTPLEYHFFDIHEGGAPPELAKLPHQVDGNVIHVQIQKGTKENGDSNLAGRIELDPDKHYCPTRMTLVMGFAPAAGDVITWDSHTLETIEVAGLTVISLARVVLSNPSVLPTERVIYLWHAEAIRKEPITRADLEINIPEGVGVEDWTTETKWVAGEPESKEPMDMEVRRYIAEALQAQLNMPAIRAERQTAMTWIVVGAFAVSAVALALVLIIRRRRYGAGA